MLSLIQSLIVPVLNTMLKPSFQLLILTFLQIIQSVLLSREMESSTITFLNLLCSSTQRTYIYPQSFSLPGSQDQAASFLFKDGPLPVLFISSTPIFFVITSFLLYLLPCPIVSPQAINVLNFCSYQKRKNICKSKDNSNHIDNKSTSLDPMSILVLTCFPPSLERALCSHCLHFSLPTHFSTQWTLTHPTISLQLA